MPVPKIKKKGNYSFLKTEADGKKELRGATFTLYRVSDNQPVATATSDSDGIVTLKNIPYGDYYFVETSVTSDDYLLSTEKYPITINVADNTKLTVPLTVIKNYKKGIFKIFKTEETGKVGLKDAVFDLYIVSGGQSVLTKVKESVDVSSVSAQTFAI